MTGNTQTTKGQVNMEKKKLRLSALSIMASMILGSASVSMLPVASAEDAPFTSIFEFNINHHPSVSFWGVPSDSAFGTPGWHLRAAIAHLLDKQEFLSSLGGKTLTDNPMSPVNSFYLNWTPDLRDEVDPLAGHSGGVGLYNELAMAADFCEARDHLIATGLFVDNNRDCIIDNRSIPTTQVILYSRVDDPERNALGIYVENQIEAIFDGADVVNRIEINLQQAFEIVIDTTVPDDWHLYTSGFQMQTNNPGSLLCTYITSTLQNPSGPSNFNFYSNPEFDEVGCRGEPTSEAQFIFGKTIVSIPVWTEP